MSCMFQDVIGVHIFSHHGNSALSPHPTASTTQKATGLFGQRVGVLLTFYFLMHVSGKLLFLLALNYMQAEILLLCLIN